MALTKSEILALYQKEVDPAIVSQRIEQMYNLLTAGQKNVVWPIVKADLTAELNSDKADIQQVQTNVNAQYNADIAAIDSKLADVAASVP